LQHKNKAQEKEKEKRKGKDLGLEIVREERARGENKENWVCRVDLCGSNRIRNTSLLLFHDLPFNHIQLLS
jgi:hypothetical protein